MLLLILLLPMLLINARLVMQAVCVSCRLFVTSVMPGLFPYLVLVLMLTSRLPQRKPGWLILLLGWCGGSPTGARLLSQCPQLSAATARRLAVASATMSPMFLLGTIPTWLQEPKAGPCILAAVLTGGLLASRFANTALPPQTEPISRTQTLVAPTPPLTFPDAVEAAAHTMLLVCGTMAMLRAAAALCTHYLAAQRSLCLLLQTLLEVTCGTEQLSSLPVPMSWRIALISGATGFGGISLILQNRAMLPAGLLSLRRQIAMQALHGTISFFLGLMLNSI